MELPAPVRTSRAPAGKRAAKRTALLAEAAHQINDRGAGAIVLNDIAERVGLSRNALYYYVADRADLVFQCYARACETMAGDLEGAVEAGGAVAAITAFVERTLAFDRPAPAILSDVDFLPEAQRDLIRVHHGRNVEALRALFRRGVREGALRRHDDALAAQALIGMLSWSLLSPAWMGRRDAPAARRRTAGAIAAVLFDGFAAPGATLDAQETDVTVLTARRFNAFDRRETGEIKAQQLVAAASRLFNRRGIDGVSLDEIGEEIGATKGAIYHYFRDKTDLVVRCYARAFELYETFMAAALAGAGPGLQRAAAVLHLNTQAQAGPLSPMMLQAGFLNLPPETRADISARARKLRLTSARNLRLGIADGSCRALDAAAASEATAGIFMWMPKWLPADGGLDTMQLAAETTDIFVFGLRPRG